MDVVVGSIVEIVIIDVVNDVVVYVGNVVVRSIFVLDVLNVVDVAIVAGRCC